MRNDPSQEEDEKLRSLDARLNEAIARHHKDDKHSADSSSPHREMADGIKAFMEMFGVLLGSGLMGWSLDHFFETAPAFLISFIFLGIGAAFFNLYKMSRNLGTAIGSNGLHREEKTARKTEE